MSPILQSLLQCCLKYMLSPHYPSLKQWRFFPVSNIHIQHNLVKVCRICNSTWYCAFTGKVTANDPNFHHLNSLPWQQLMFQMFIIHHQLTWRPQKCCINPILFNWVKQVLAEEATHPCYRLTCRKSVRTVSIPPPKKKCTRYNKYNKMKKMDATSINYVEHKFPTCIKCCNIVLMK